jgi:hypothetical protein
MRIEQVSAVAQQWGDKVTITDIAEMTVYHPLFQKAIELVGLQVGETLERNTFNTLNSGTQVNYVNSRGARASLVAGDVLNPFEVTRAYAQLFTLGAPRYMGDEMTDEKLDADAGGARASKSPRLMPHFVSIIHPFVGADFRQNASVQTAWSYSDVNRLYNFECGEWNGIRFCESNMVPSFTGIAAVQGTVGNSGSLATNTYFIQVTGSDTQNQFESNVYQISNALSVVGPNGSVSVTVPSTTGFTYNVYISTSAAMVGATLGLSTSGPTTGPLQGQATQVPAGSTIIVTGSGSVQTPPAAPATGVTVYPTYILGRGAYGQVMLDDVKFTYLKEPDKSDPLNQLRIVGWKCMYGTLLENQQFFMRIESTSAFSGTFG